MAKSSMKTTRRRTTKSLTKMPEKTHKVSTKSQKTSAKKSAKTTVSTLDSSGKEEEDQLSLKEVVRAIFDKQDLSLEYDSIMKQLALTTRERDVMVPVVALLRDILTCTICLAYMEDPVTLQCGHTFCMLCFTSESDAQKNRSKDLEKSYCCSICRTLIERDKVPARTHSLHKLLAILPAELNAHNDM